MFISPMKFYRVIFTLLSTTILFFSDIILECTGTNHHGLAFISHSSNVRLNDNNDTSEPKILHVKSRYNKQMILLSMASTSTTRNNNNMISNYESITYRYPPEDDLLYAYQRSKKIYNEITMVKPNPITTTPTSLPTKMNTNDTIHLQNTKNNKTSISQDYLDTIPSLTSDVSTTTSNNNKTIQSYNTTKTIQQIQNIQLSLSNSQILELHPLQRYTYRIAQLLRYKDTHNGSLDVPYNYQEDVQLAKWVQSQRYEYKLLLKQQQQQQIQQEGQEVDGERKGKDDSKHKQQSSSTTVNDGIRSYLTPERLDLLNAIDFPWVSSASYYSLKRNKNIITTMSSSSSMERDAGTITTDNDLDHNARRGRRYNGLTTKWMKYWYALQRYREENGHVRVPPKYVCAVCTTGNTCINGDNDNSAAEVYAINSGDGDGLSSKDVLKLGVWVKNQRKNYNDRKRYFAKKKAQDLNTDTINDDSTNNRSDIMTDVDEPTFQMTPDRIEKLNELEFVWNVKDSGLTSYNVTWNRRFQELCSFHKEHGHFIVPHSCPEYPYLSDWTKNQRVLYRNYEKSDGDVSYSGLNSARIGLLNSISFDWDGQKGLAQLRNDTWWNKFELLKEFRGVYGDFDVDTIVMRNDDGNVLSTNEAAGAGQHGHPSKFKQLHHWVKLQRVEYNRYQKQLRKSTASNNEVKTRSPLTPERIKAMDDIGFVWNLRDKDWNKMFQQLKDYHAQYGHFSVPTDISTTKDSLSEDKQILAQLGRWTRSQRCVYRKYITGEKLPDFIDQRMKALRHIGFMNDTYILQTSCDGDDCTIQLQVYDEAKNIVTVKPTSERIRKAMRSCTKGERQHMWQAQFVMLQKYKEEHGHTFVKHEDDPYLAWWVRMQRKRYSHLADNKGADMKRGDKQSVPSSLILDRVRMLKEIDFIFNVNDYKFETHMYQLKEYQEKYGHIKVSQKKDPHLYSFIKRQRELYRMRNKSNHMKRTPLTEKRVNMLEDIGFIWLPRGV